MISISYKILLLRQLRFSAMLSGEGRVTWVDAAADQTLAGVA